MSRIIISPRYLQEFVAYPMDIGAVTVASMTMRTVLPTNKPTPSNASPEADATFCDFHSFFNSGNSPF
ncbi:hypothetical protein [Bacillus sp. ISL-46]|uniref:hypothetical protein n=1 Tax=Bacillus sp. ISL-46 TaxID=2819129 RepID=UPI001BEC05EE|nr:hypothetical protein [Bacillus sp. ISL-46]MBT2720743.1 hypothetical protein [Bacillus sp. ISL-46]